MKLLAIDVSGNWKEGKGTSGICWMADGEVVALGELKASDFKSPEEYWVAHEDLIKREWPDQLIVEGYKLYNHAGKAAKMQANSELETPQLIGVLKMVAYRLDIPITIQFASEIKTRWSENILVQLGYLEQKGNRYYWKDQLTSSHKRDSMKHALHFERYKK